MRLHLLSLLAVPLTLQAADPQLPPGVEVGEKIYSIDPSATSLDEANLKVLSKGETDIQVQNGGIRITSLEENPFLELREEISGETVIRLAIQFDPTTNHFFRLSFFDVLGLEYNSQFKRFALLEKTDRKPYAYEFNTVQQKQGALDTFAVNPGEFVLTIAVTQAKVMVWCDDLQLFSFPLENVDLSGLFRIRSGWHSNWAITSLEIFKLKSIP